MSSSHRRGRGRPRTAAYAVALAGAGLGTLVPVDPTGVEVMDRLLAGLVVGSLALAATRAQRWTWLVLTGVTATFASTTLAGALGVAGIAVASLASWRQRPLPVAGALAGTLGGLASFRMVDGGYTGVSLLLGALAAGPVLVSGYQLSRRSARRSIRVALGVAAGVLVVVVLGYGVALATARASANSGVDRLERAMALARQGELDEAGARLDAAGEALDRAAGALSAPWALPARLVPGLGQNARAVSEALDLARDLTGDVADLVETASSDELGVRSGRIDPAVFDQFAEPVGRLLSTVGTAQARADSLDSPWLAPPVSNRLGDVRDELDRARETADLAVDAIDALPVLLGAGGEQRYLVLFVTPVEARATGFPGNFGELVVTDGRFEMARFGRISELAFPPGGAALDLPQPFLDRYARFGIGFQWRSVTISPDFPSVAKLAAQLYPQTGGRPVDGVMSVDPAGIAALLRFTGPITVAGIDEPLTAGNAEEFLLRDQYVDFPDTPDRIDALESLGEATFQRLTTGDLPPPQQLGRVLGPVAEAGHIRLVSFDPVAGPFLSRIGLDHPLPAPTADSLAVTTTNAVGGKLDLFLHRTIDYQATWDPETGEIGATVRIEVRNEAPSQGLPDYVIGSALGGELGASIPPGTNRMVLSVFSPLQAEEALLDGEPAVIANTIEGGYQVYETEVVLAPNGGTAVFELRLEGSIPAGADYELELWNQVLAVPDELDVEVDVLGNTDFTSTTMDVDGRLTSANVVLDRPRRLAIHPDA